MLIPKQANEMSSRSVMLRSGKTGANHRATRRQIFGDQAVVLSMRLFAAIVLEKRFAWADDALREVRHGVRGWFFSTVPGIYA